MRIHCSKPKRLKFRFDLLQTLLWRDLKIVYRQENKLLLKNIKIKSDSFYFPTKIYIFLCNLSFNALIHGISSTINYYQL